MREVVGDVHGDVDQSFGVGVYGLGEGNGRVDGDRGQLSHVELLVNGERRSDVHPTSDRERGDGLRSTVCVHGCGFRWNRDAVVYVDVAERSLGGGVLLCHGLGFELDELHRHELSSELLHDTSNALGSVDRDGGQLSHVELLVDGQRSNHRIDCSGDAGQHRFGPAELPVLRCLRGRDWGLHLWLVDSHGDHDRQRLRGRILDVYSDLHDAIEHALLDFRERYRQVKGLGWVVS